MVVSVTAHTLVSTMDERYLLINDIDESEARLMFAWINGLPEKANATIEILSHGGLCFAGTGIAQKIIEAQSRGIVFTAKVYGIVASAASDIALACNRIAMAMGAQLMIHSAWNEFLDPNDPGIQRANESQLALIHRKLPNYTAEDLKQDRWLNAEEAVKLGVCDEYINMSEVMATFQKVAARYTLGGLKMKKTEKLNAEVEAVKAEAPCMENNEEKKDEETKAMDDDIMTIDVLEKLAQRLDDIEKRLALLEGNKADDEGASDGAESGDQIAARLNSLYARLSGGKADEKPVVATTGKVSKKAKMEASFERSKKIDLKSFV